jgi:O-antigen/teichoic acid export membrane protein
LEKVGIQGLSAIVGLFMTRLLTPYDYGLIAMLDIFIAVGLLVADRGLAQGFIHDQEASEEDQSLIFLFNLISATVVYAFLFFISGTISRFYAQPQLMVITRVFALNIPIQAFGMIHQARLMKSLQVRVLTKIKLFSLFISGFVGIYLSYINWGPWALVYYFMLYNLINSILLCTITGWQPIWSFKFGKLKKYFSYTIKLFSTNMLDALYTNFFTMFISKFYQAATGGLYSKARLLQNMPVISATQLIQSVSFPVLSKVQNDDQQSYELFRRQVKVLSYVISLVMGIMVLTARPFVVVVLTDKWLGMVPFFQLLCILGWFLPFHTLHACLLNSKGRSDITLRLEIFKKSIAIAGVVIAYRLGVQAIIIAQIIAALIGLLLHVWYSKKFIPYSLFNQLVDLFVPFVLCAGIVTALLALGGYVHSNIVLFFISTILIIGLYIGLTSLFGFSEIQSLKNLLKSGFLRNSNSSPKE